ncbi:MAG: hypothetical protein HC884_19345 [Chloroflexaceae bacterium]|nr:hypothetical protein [Chloroflexaceae bacterium]
MRTLEEEKKARLRDQYETHLGTPVCAELRQASPQEPLDSGPMRDRFVLNPGAFAYWLLVHFDLAVLFADDEVLQAISIDRLAETVSIYETDYHLPHWCYLSTGLEPGDLRPTSWSGFPADIVATLEQQAREAIAQQARQDLRDAGQMEMLGDGPCE